MTATATAAPSTSACAITARDFESSTASVNWKELRWSVGALRHVVTALDGAPVAVVTDKRTGHAEVGSRLVGTLANGTSIGADGPRLVVERTLSDGTTQRTNFRVEDIGTIIPLAESGTGAKWVALDLMRKESAAATAWAREQAKAATWTYGKTSTTHFVDFIDVRYESQGEGPRSDYIRVPLSAIA